MKMKTNRETSIMKTPVYLSVFPAQLSKSLRAFHDLANFSILSSLNPLKTVNAPEVNCTFPYNSSVISIRLSRTRMQSILL